MIRAEKLCFGYGQTDAVHDIDAAFPGGHITGILGPNGSGKSTLLRLLTGLIAPRCGRVLLDGGELRRLSPRSIAREIAYLPQSRPLPMITVRSLVCNGRYPYLGLSRRLSADDEAAVESALYITGMAALAGRELRTLSGGERQKAYIAMLIAQGAGHLLLDEPTTFLDIGHQLELMDILRSLRNSGKCVVMVLHDIDLAVQVCDDVIMLNKGGVIYNGTSDGLLTSGAAERAYGVRPQPNTGTRFERM